MLKKHERAFNFLQQLSDALAVTAAWLFSYYIRFEIMTGGDHGLGLYFFSLTPLIIIFTIFFFYKNELYISNRYYSWYKEILSVIYSNFQAISALVIFFYFLAPNRLSRITLMIYVLVSVFTTITVRLLSRNFIKSMRMKGRNLRFIILAGHNSSIKEYVEAIYNIRDAGLQIAGWIDSGGMSKEYNIPELRPDDLDLSSDNRTEGREIAVDAIVIGYPSHKSTRLSAALKLSQKYPVPTFVLPDIAYTFIRNSIEDFEGIPMIKVNSPGMSIIDIALKRMLDITGASLGLILLSPFYLIISLAVKITSKGPIFYGQERVSLDGENFKMWKFRSMRTDAEQSSGAVWTVENDDRRTPIGAFLRATSIDELPQLWNVLIGTMSLVGPRPERPVFVEKFKNEIPAYMLRHKMKAGITGWAQVNGWRGNTSLEKRIDFDIYYIKNWNLFFDLKIILLTFVKGFVNKNAY